MKSWLVIALSAGLAACSSNNELTLKPAELSAVDATFPVTESWSADTGKGNDGKYIALAPLRDGQRLVITDIEGRVSARGLDTGKVIWGKDLDMSISAGVGGGLGVAVVGSSEGELIALSTEDGSQRWRSKMSAQVLEISDADSGMVVARLGGGKVVGVSLADGSVAWEFVRESPSLSLQGQGKPLTAHGGVALGMDDGSVVMLQLRTGNPIWEAVLATGRGRTELDRLVDVDGTLQLDGNELFAVAYQGNIAAIDARNGRLIWSKEASSSTGVVVDNKAVFFTDNSGVVHALSRNTGIEIWSQSGLENRRVTRPTLMGNSVLVGDYDGYLHWLDKDSGQFIQRKRAASSGILLPPVDLAAAVAVLADNGDLSLWTSKDSN